MIDQCYVGDVRDGLRSFIAAGIRAQTCVTSPPYWGLRDYGVAGQLGLESTPAEYVANMVEVFRLVRDALADDGTVFLNIGDSYYSSGGDAPGKRSEGIGQAGFSDGLRRARRNGNAGTAGSDSTYRDSTSGSLGDARIDAWWHGIASTDLGRALAQVAEPLSQIRARTESLLGHLPTADFSDRTPIRQSLAATLDQATIAIHVLARLREVLASTPRESLPQHPASYHLLDTASACLGSLHSLTACVRRCVRMLGGSEESIDCTADSALPFAELAHCIQCTDGCCSLLFSWLYYREVEPQCPALKPKDLVGIPWRLAFALQADGWYLRSDIIWHKPNPMPESVTDRPTKAHEYLFLLSKSERYFYDAAAIREKATSGRVDMASNGLRTGLAYVEQDAAPSNSAKKHRAPAGWKTGPGAHGSIHSEGREQDVKYYDVEALDRNKRTVWTIPTESYAEAHFATFPTALVEPCILAGSRVGDVVLDPFMGSGTVAQVAQSLGRRWIGCELNPAYVELQKRRAAQLGLALA